MEMFMVTFRFCLEVRPPVENRPASRAPEKWHVKGEAVGTAGIREHLFSRLPRIVLIVGILVPQVHQLSMLFRTTPGNRSMSSQPKYFGVELFGG